LFCPHVALAFLLLLDVAEESDRDMIVTFTLDTNCLIDVDDGRPAAPYVLRLIEAADKGVADVALVASSASERQPGVDF
jgi:hypothetical protein